MWGLGKTSPPHKKKMFSFGHCPKGGGGGGGRPLSEFFVPFFYHVIVPKIGKFLPKTLYICMFFGNFCHHYHQNHHHNYHCNRHYNHMHFSVIRAKRRFWRPKKRYQGVIRAMAEGKHFFGGRSSLRPNEGVDRGSGAIESWSNVDISIPIVRLSSSAAFNINWAPLTQMNALSVSLQVQKAIKTLCYSQCKTLSAF